MLVLGNLSPFSLEMFPITYSDCENVLMKKRNIRSDSNLIFTDSKFCAKLILIESVIVEKGILE